MEEKKEGQEKEQKDGLLLKLSHLTKSYDGNTNAIEDLNLTLDRGEFVSIIGCSGAGKSTLLRCINRLIAPTSGSVEFDGREVTELRGRELRKLRRRIAMVFQHYNLVYRSSAIENVLQGRLGYKNTIAGALGFFTEEEKKNAFEMLDRVGLADFAYTRADQLSGGQRQRVGIARAFMQDPLLILADEPIASLDPKSSNTVMEHLRWAVDEMGVGALVSLHQVDFALQFSDRIIGVAGGKILFDGKPSELTRDMIAAIYGTELEEGDVGFDIDAIERFSEASGEKEA